MTAAQTSTIPGQRIAPFAVDVVVPIAAITAVLHCIASAFGDGYWFDEVYMLAIGRHHIEWGIGRSAAVGARARWVWQTVSHPVR